MISRNIDKAREAYLSKDVEKMKEAHLSLSTEQSRHKEKHKKGGEFLKSAVYGGLDGMITTYSVVMGAAGADLSPGIVLILGIANMIGKNFL